MTAALRHVARRAVPAVLRRASRRVLSAGRGTRRLSVVIPVYNVERYLAECLDSVLAQGVEDMELIVVDDGSTDGTAEMVAAYAARDRRVRPLRQEHAGQGAARNRAVSVARGEFLTFVDGDDVVPPGAHRAMLAALRRSGSDFVVGAARRLEGATTSRPSWNAAVHEHDRIGVTIDDVPQALLDVIACNRVFRRRFWVDRVGRFTEGMAYEDHLPMVAAYLRADRFDLLSRVTYDWRIRDDGTSTGQQKHELRNLTDRVHVKADTWRLVEAEASERVRAAWIGRVLDIDFPPFVERALEADSVYRGTLQDALATYVGLATPVALGYVRVRQKIRTFLASQGAWAVLETVERVFDEQGSIPPTTIRDGSVRLASSPAMGTGVTLPDELLELGRSESRLQVCLAACDVRPGGRLRLTGWAVIRAVDLSSRIPSLRLSLVDDTGSHRIDLRVASVPLPEATAWVNWPHGSFDRAGFKTDIDLAELASDEPRSAAWHLEARVDVNGVTREGGVHHALAESSASRAALGGREVSLGARVAVPAFDRQRGFGITLRAADRPRR